MKTIVVQHQNGFKSYVNFSESDVINVFSKIARSSGFIYIDSEEAFDEFKEFWYQFEFKIYKGVGIYNEKCEFLSNEFVDPEDGIKYTLSDCNESIKEVQLSYKIKIIDNLKFICKSQIFN